ncbi:hypothetical protein Tsubulata_047989 [Turnera subulata]|uniref:3-oxo-5-alpha-steroid 4-dehydrogenase C-terminal domain-containing protein n=1 Tax=Turnera subulata TaxID=218843 RepID=A0A9Q0FG05_9ROSI|nr:hypothetical protein Tsubulata_047989 [Turnera subulata]
MAIMLWPSLLSILVLVYLLLKSRKQKHNLPPSPPALPIIGHLHLMKKPIHRTMQSLSQKYGPIISFRFGSRSILVLSSPSAVQECFTKNDIVFANRPPLLISKYLNYNCTTLVATNYGEHWRNLRRISAIEIFSSARLRTFRGIREDEVKILLRKLYHASKHGFSKVGLRSVLMDMTYNSIMRMVAGKRYYGEDVEDIEGAREFKDIIREYTKYAGMANLGDCFPVLERLIGCNGFVKKLVKLSNRMDLFMQNLIEEHRANYKDGNTMIDHLLALQESQPEYYTDGIIKGFILTILLGGTKTSATALEWALSNLLNNPDVLRKARQELEAQVGQDRLINESDFPNLPYLQNIISENLRLYPVNPLSVPHMSSTDCTIGGYYVPGGTMLFVNTYAMHRDPNLWEDAASFKPERFENAEKFEANYMFLPFGMGRRACPGDGLANRVMTLGLGSLIQCFDWERIGEELINMDEFAAVTMRVAGFGLCEVLGIHLQYSKFWTLGAQNSIRRQPIKLSSRTGMLLLYTPAFLFGVASFLLFPDGDLRLLLVQLTVTLHFFKRDLELLCSFINDNLFSVPSTRISRATDRSEIPWDPAISGGNYWSYVTRKWYLSKFEDFPSSVKALIPYNMLLSHPSNKEEIMESMWLLTLVVLSIFFLVYLVLKSWLQITRKQEHNLPPSPPALPIIGHLHLMRKPIHRTLQSLSQRYGPIISLSFGSRPVLVLSSPAAAQECFTKNDIIFANRPPLLLNKYLHYNSTTLASADYGEHWRNLRRISAIEIFSSARLRTFRGIREDEALSCFEAWFLQSRVTLLTDMTYNSIMRMVGAGKRYYGEVVEDSEEAREFKEIVQEYTKYAGTANMVDYFSVLEWVGCSGFVKRLVKLSKRMDLFMQNLIEEHRANYKDGNTMIDHLLALQESQPEYYTDGIIKGFILVMLLGGTKTSAVALEWALANLLNHPSKMISMLAGIIFPPPMFIKAMSVISMVSLANVGLSEVRGKHMQYSKFWKVGTKINPTEEKLHVSSRTGMLIAYSPAFLVAVSSFVVFPDEGLRSLLVKSCIAIHFLKRILEVLFVHRFSGAMGVESLIPITSSYFTSTAMVIYAQHLAQGLPDPPVDLMYPGIVLFLIGITGNFYHHCLLTRLRSKDSKEYKVPEGGLFGLVICPHYLFEILDFVGISFISQTLYGFCFTAGTTFYLMGRSYATRRWYLSKFKDLSRDIKALVPFAVLFRCKVDHLLVSRTPEIREKTEIKEMASLLLGIIFPPPLFIKAMSVISLVIAAYLGLSEVKGKHMLYSKFWKAGAKNIHTEDKIHICSRSGMLMAYMPAFLVCVSSFGIFQDEGLRFRLVKSCLTLHFFKRVLEVLFVHKYSGGIAVESLVPIASGYSTSAAMTVYAQYLTQELSEPQVDLKYPGIVLFLIGIIGNFYHHYILSKLRSKDDDKGYKVPKGGLFDLVLCPHYLFEIIDLMGISFMSQTLYAFCFAIGTTIYLMGRGYATRRWYLSKFKDLPRDMKALIPFVF